MFTLTQIQDLHKKVKSGADFPHFVQDLKSIGVARYDVYVADGSTVFYGADDFILQGPAKYDALVVSNDGSSEKIKHSISIHQQGQTDYPTFCKHAAEAGVEKWTTHLFEMTVTYWDKQNNPLLVEPIHSV